MSDVTTIREALRYPDSADMTEAQAALVRLVAALAACADSLSVHVQAGTLTGAQAEEARGLVADVNRVRGVVGR